MSLDINELVRLVKQAAVEAVRADAPMAVCYGTVLSTAPLKIQVDQKKILGEAQLILTDNVRDFNVVLSTIEGEGKSQGPHYTENESGGSGYALFESHRHKYQGRKKWRVHNALKVGEKVILSLDVALGGRIHEMCRKGTQYLSFVRDNKNWRLRLEDEKRATSQ